MSAPESDSAPRRKQFPGALTGYAAGFACVAACTGVSLVRAGALGIADQVIVFPLGVLVVAARFGMGPSVFTAAFGVLAFDYLILPPRLTFAVGETKHVLTLSLMLIVALLIGILTDRLRRQAEQARRQAEVERLRNALLSALSHDLRTPLSALVGASTALYEDRLSTEERRELAHMVAEEALRLNRLVSNLLELTRLEAGKVVVKRVPQAIDESVGAALRRVEKQLHGRPVHTDVPEEVPLASFDPVLIEQVFVNLLENAAKYTPPGSPIDISVTTNGEEISIEVADRGPGVRHGEEERVFERLYRGDARGDGGVGLGLTICRAIVTAHDGRIWIARRKGGGAAVHFTLPAEKNIQEIRDSVTDPATPELVRT